MSGKACYAAHPLNRRRPLHPGRRELSLIKELKAGALDFGTCAPSEGFVCRTYCSSIYCRGSYCSGCPVKLCSMIGGERSFYPAGARWTDRAANCSKPPVGGIMIFWRGFLVRPSGTLQGRKRIASSCRGFFSRKLFKPRAPSGLPDNSDLSS